MRLQKYMAQCGVASRRACEQLIAQGRVSVNGETIHQPGTQVEPEDTVQLDGQLLTPEQTKRTIILYKPKLVVCTAHDPEGRPTVLDIVQVSERVYPVGRLDYDSQGLLLLTNDGDLARALTHPSIRVEKTYRVRVKGIPTHETICALRRGVLMAGEDRPTAPANVIMLRTEQDTADLRMTLTEGRNRQVRRMLEHFDHPVVELVREREANMTLDGLGYGQWRDLTSGELKRLRQTAGLDG